MREADVLSRYRVCDRKSVGPCGAGESVIGGTYH